MNNILVWIDSSIKIKSKIIKMVNSLQDEFSSIMLFTKDEKTASIYRSKFSNVYSIEKTLINFLNKEVLKKINIKNSNLNSDLLAQIYLLGFHKNSYLDNKFNFFNLDPIVELSIFKHLWLKFINEKKITHTLILNGFSLPSFALSCIASTENLNHLFWENGLLPNSLFINKSGVNALSNPEIFINSEKILNKSFDNTTIKDLIYSISNNKNKNQNILVTLQVDNDSNIKIFSPFFGINDFMYFICSDIAINNEFNIRFRNHPKNKFKIPKKYRNLGNISLSDNNNSLIQDFNWSDLVITINSTTGLESIFNKKPLISFGNSFYSKFLKECRYKYLGDFISFFIYDPSNEEQLFNIQNLKKALNNFSLNVQESDEIWQNKILSNFAKDLKPFHKNNELIKYLTFTKYLKFRKNIKNNYKKNLSFVLMKIIFILKIIQRKIS